MSPASPPPPDISRGASLVIASSILHAISLPVVATRIWTRSTPKLRLWWDDYTVLAAAVFDLANWTLILLAVRYGLGRPSFYVPLADQPEGRAFLYFAQHASGWAIAFAKISIALMLFRLRPDNKMWKIFLLGMMLIPVAIAVTTSSVLFSACKPLAAMWDFTIPDPVCQPFSVTSKSILATAVMTVVTDFVLALLPLTFIAHIQRTTCEKVVIAFIMSIGLVAGAASICKIVVVSANNLTGDTLLDGVDVSFWGMLEMQLGIIAACVPCLKGLTESILYKVGLLSRTTPTSYHLDRENSTAPGNHYAAAVRSARLSHGPNAVENEEVSAWELTPHGTPHGSTVSTNGLKAWDAVI